LKGASKVYFREQKSQKDCISVTHSLFWRIFIGTIYFPV
jgi:hypothetical protein